MNDNELIVNRASRARSVWRTREKATLKNSLVVPIRYKGTNGVMHADYETFQCSGFAFRFTTNLPPFSLS